jgi:hypothetical protein
MKNEPCMASMMWPVMMCTPPQDTAPHSLQFASIAKRHVSSCPTTCLSRTSCARETRKKTAAKHDKRWR